MFIKGVIRFVLFLAFAVSPVTKAAIISSFDADTTLTISADFNIIDLETFFDDEFVSASGGGSGAVSGTGDSLFDLVSGNETTLNAFADGSVSSSPGSVLGYYLSSGGFTFENTGGSSSTGVVSFDFTLFASMLTNSIDESALAFSSIVIGFEHYNSLGLIISDDIFVDEMIEFDSSFEGVGPFSDSFAALSTSTFTLNVDESILYYFELDASGYADTTRAATVSEPATLMIFAMAVMCLSIRRFSVK